MDNKNREKKREGNRIVYVCELCDFVTHDKTKHHKHLETIKHKIKKGEEHRNMYECVTCDYITHDKTKYNKHLETIKHKRREEGEKKGDSLKKMSNKGDDFGETDKKGENEREEKSNELDENAKKKEEKGEQIEYFFCVCGKKYKHKPNLYAHKKKCIDICGKNQNADKMGKENYEKSMLETMKECFLQLLKDNKEFNNAIIESLKSQPSSQIAQSTLISGNNNNNNNNNKFNINLFLNEKCKDAMSMNEFIETIDVTLQDLLVTKDKGFASGISNIFLKGINKLSPYKRPIHCTDVKRETLYIKNEKWEKDANKESIKEAIKTVSAKQFKCIKKYKDAKPNYMVNENERDEYLNIVKNATDKLDGNNEKIIKDICNTVYVKDGERLIEGGR
jgi:hypothetical protein